MSEGVFDTQKMSEVVKDSTLVAEIVDWYISVFNDKALGEWAENWTKEEVHKKLFVDTAAELDRSFIRTWRVGGRLVGATIVFIEKVDEAFSVKDLPPESQDDATLADLKEHLDWLIGLDTVIAHYREFGIIRKYRGGMEPVFQLFVGSLPKEARGKADYICFWTSKKSRLFPIMAGLNSQIAYEFGDDLQNVLMLVDCFQTNRRMKMPLKKIVAMIIARCKHFGIK